MAYSAQRNRWSDKEAGMLNEGQRPCSSPPLIAIVLSKKDGSRIPGTLVHCPLHMTPELEGIYLDFSGSYSHYRYFVAASPTEKQ